MANNQSTCPLEAKDLSVTLDGKEIINIPSLQVRPGEVLVVMGPNGSGKTTLLLALALLLKPTTGTILYDGKPVNDRSSALGIRRRIAVVFQDSLLLNMTVWDNVILGPHLRGIKGEEANERTRRWLERFGIASLARRPAKTLSGGEAKRASLARAFVLNPEILFLDEPFNSLDAPTRQALIEDFQGVVHETGVTTVMVTHDRNEALALADRIAVLMDGRIRIIGTPSEVFAFTEDEKVAKFIDVGNVLRGTVDSQTGGLARVKVGNLEMEVVSDLSAGIPVAICLAYEDITLLLPANQTVSSARNRFVGEINKLLPVGSQVRVTVDCGFPLVAVITQRSRADMGLELGQKIIASFKASSIHLIPHQKSTDIPESGKSSGLEAIQKLIN
jgi:tungstate transport system ATP-binding protein